MFIDFAKQWGFLHITSSPTYPQSNGKNEATVKSMKKLICTSWMRNCLDDGKLAQALLQYRNTPSQRDGLSPAQKLFGRPVQDTLPGHNRDFKLEWQRSAEEADQIALHHKEKVESYYNRHARHLPEIYVGSKVAIQNSITKLWDIYGVVTDIGPHRRYYIKTTSGRVLVHNSRFLHRHIPVIPPQDTTFQPNTVTPPATPSPPPVPNRRSSRPHKKSRRLMKKFSLHAHVKAWRGRCRNHYRPY